MSNIKMSNRKLVDFIKWLRDNPSSKNKLKKNTLVIIFLKTSQQLPYSNLKGGEISG